MPFATVGAVSGRSLRAANCVAAVVAVEAGRITFSTLFAFLHALPMLPARLLGWTPGPGERAMA
jgi:hypothetical protein